MRRRRCAGCWFIGKVSNIRAQWHGHEYVTMAPQDPLGSLVSNWFANRAGVFDGAAHDFGDGLFDHQLFAGVAADDGVGSGFDETNLLGVDDEGLAVETGEYDHESDLRFT